MALNQHQIIDRFRRTYREEMEGKSDEEIYSLADEWTQKEYGKTLKPYKDPTPNINGVSLNSLSQNISNPTTQLEKTDVSPKAIDGLFGSVANILTNIPLVNPNYNPAQHFTESGLFYNKETGSGISPEFFQYTMNNSLAGMFYQTMYGEDKYKVEDYNPEWFAEAGSFMLGMANPLEVATLMLSGPLGKVASRGGISLLHKYGMLGLRTGAKNKIKGMTGINMIEGALESGITLGNLGAIHALFGDSAHQSKTTGEVDWQKSLLAGANGWVDSFLIGAPSGALARGWLGTKYAMAKLASDDKTLALSTRILTGMPAQIGTEVAAFSALPNLYKEIGHDSYKDYPDLFSQEWLEMMRHNAIVIGTMHTYGSAYKKWKGVDDGHVYALKLLERAVADAKRINSKVGNVKDTMSSQGINLDPALLEIISQKNSTVLLSDNEINLFKNNQKRMIEILKKNKKNWTDEDVDFMLTEGNVIKLQELGLLAELRENPEIFKEILNEISPKKITDEEFAAYQAGLESKIGTITEEFNTFNNILTGKSSDKRDIDTNSSEPFVKMVKKGGLVDEWGNPTDVIEVRTGEIESRRAEGYELVTEAHTTVSGVPTIGDLAQVVINGKTQFPGARKINGKRDLADGTSEYRFEGNPTWFPESQLQLKVSKGGTFPTTPDRSTKVESIYDNLSTEIARTIDKLLTDKGIGFDVGKAVKKAQAKIEKLENEMFQYYEKGKQEPSFKSNREGIDKRLKLMEDVPQSMQSDVIAVLDFMFSGTDNASRIKVRKQSRAVAKYVNWLHKTKGKTVAESNYTDVHEYANDVIMARAGKSYITGDDLAPFSNFYKFINKQYHPDGLLVRSMISYEQANKNRTLRVNDPKGGVDPKKYTNLNADSIRDVIKQIRTKYGDKVITEEVATELLLTGRLARYVLRAEEINALKVKNIKYDETEGWYIDITPDIVKAGTAPRRIPITTKLAEDLRAYGQNKAENLIIPKRNIKGKTLNVIFAEAIFGEKYTIGMIRRMIETLALDPKIIINQMTLDHFVGHITTLKQIYTEMGEVAISQDLRNMKVLQEQLGIRKLEGKFQKDMIGKPMDKTELIEFLGQELKKNPGLIIKTLQDKNYSGRFLEGIIDVTLGKANMHTFYHENSHRLKAMIDATGNKELGGLWKQAEKIFKDDAKKQGKEIEEFISDTLADYGVGRKMNKTITSKIGSWAKRFWSKVKKVFLGKERLNQNDIQRLLGEKVFKGFAFSSGPLSSSISKYKFASKEAMARQIESDFKFAIKQTGREWTTAERKAFMKYVAAAALIEKPEDFSFKNPNITEAELTEFSRALDVIPFKKFKKITDLAKEFSIREVVHPLLPKAFSPKEQEAVLKLLGVKSGRLWDADIRQLEQLQTLVHKIKYKEDYKLGWIYDNVDMADIGKEMKKLDGVLGQATRFGLPVGIVVEKLGLQGLADKLYTHAGVELHHIGRFIKFEDTGKELFGSRWDGIIGKGMKDTLYLIDQERYLERKATGDLTAREIKFMERAMNKEWLNGQKFKNNKDAVNNFTKEGQLVGAWLEFTDYIVRAFDEATSTNLTEGQFAQFKKENNVNWIKNNIYVSRLVTKQFKKIFNLDSKAGQKLVNEQSTALALEMAIEKHGPNPTSEQVNKFTIDAEKYVRANLNDMMGFTVDKYSSKFLKKRHTKLPEFIEYEGKRIQVYETKYENTFKPYALGMSKFLSNAQIFPEYVQLGGYNFPGLKAELHKLKEQHGKWGNWIEEQVSRQIGRGKDLMEFEGFISKGTNRFAQYLAKLQLSLPTSGLKNVVLGASQNLTAFRMGDYFGSLIDTISKQMRDNAKLTGMSEIGLRHLETKHSSKIMDTIFKFGGMKPTENFNRYTAIYASKRDQLRLVRHLRNPNTSKSKRKKALTRLEKFYKLSKSEIQLLEKYGMDSVNGYKFKSSYEKGVARRNLETVYQKMNTYAHINTQGASMNLFMPEWADRRFIRPLTLYKRMAYAATVNSVRNFQVAYKTNDFPRLVGAMAAPFINGYMMQAAWKHFFGVQTPNENSNWNQYMTSLAASGEGLGIASEIIALYQGQNISHSMYPAVYNWALETGKGLMYAYQGKQSIGHSFDDFMRNTIRIYDGGKKIMDKKVNKFHGGKQKYRKLWYEFFEEVFPNKEQPIGERLLTKRSPYYRDFDMMFYKGTSKQFTEHAIAMVYGVAVDYYNAGITDKGVAILDFSDALKKSVKTMENKLKQLNPNPGSFVKSNKSYSIEWIKWLMKDKTRGKKYLQELKKLESEYFFKVAMFNKLKDPYLKDPEMKKQITEILKGIR